MKKAVLPAIVAGLFAGGAAPAFAAAFDAGNLIVSRTVYQDVGDVASIQVGSALPYGGTAVGDGTFANVFKNESPDPSFGVSSAIYLDQLTTSGSFVNTLNVDSSLMTTSFASKSELALNVSSDGSAVTFMGYKAAVGSIDISNSNTAAVNDPTNAVTATYQRAIGQVNLNTGATTITGVNAYSGNNGRAAVLVNGSYYTVGNAGNSSTVPAGTKPSAATLNALSANTGVQMISATNPGAGNTTVIGAGPTATTGTGTTSQKGGQYGFDVTQAGYTADKTGKDDNFRGMTVYNGTLYVTKGSGGNGINTVYQVGTAGALNNGGSLPSNASITILPGFSTTLASASSGVEHPFGIWFGDATHLFVADEGDGTRSLTKAASTSGGLEEWALNGGVWSKLATFQSGLIDQVSQPNGLGWSVKEDGLRNITGRKNADGTFTIFGTTSTVSDETTHDLGADPNELVSITIGANSTATNTSFTVLETAAVGVRLGGVAIAPVPEPQTYALFAGGLGLLGFMTRRRKL